MKLLKYPILLAASLLFTFSLTWSQAPDTDLFLVEIAEQSDGTMLGEPVNITSRRGYDNQPMFSADGSYILYTSMRGTQTDIYKYDLQEQSSEALMITPESEYSPTLMPESERLSVVVVEEDSTQRVWSYTLEGEEGQFEYQEVNGVGYSCWGGRNRILATFLVTDPPSLKIFENEEVEGVFTMENVGRSLHKIPEKDAISLVDKSATQEDGSWMIKSLDLDSKEMTDIIPTLPDYEDYAWGPDGTIWMPAGMILYKFKPGEDSYWVPMAEFQNVPDIDSFYRIAINPEGNLICLVGTHPKVIKDK